MKLQISPGRIIDRHIQPGQQLLLCIVFSHPLWCGAQQAGLRQKPSYTAPRQFSQPAAPRQAPNQAPTQPAPQQGATQTGTQAGAAPPAGDSTRSSTATASPQTHLPTGKTNNVAFTDQLGGMLYSSGTEDIHVRILPNGPHPPWETVWMFATTWVHSDIYLVSPGPERFIGHNIPGGGSMNLGKLPEGEIIFAIKTYDGFTFQNGGADRNPDLAVHAFTRTFALGPVEVWFEDSALNSGRCDHDMDDVAIQLTGGVRGNGPWAELQKAVDAQSAGKQGAGKRDVQNAPQTAKP